MILRYVSYPLFPPRNFIRTDKAERFKSVLQGLRFDTTESPFPRQIKKPRKLSDLPVIFSAFVACIDLNLSEIPKLCQPKNAF
jgi:hypothetical protein